jgi:hypothetical protein
MVNFWLLSFGYNTSSYRDDKRYGDGSPSFNAGSFVDNSYVSDVQMICVPNSTLLAATAKISAGF